MKSLFDSYVSMIIFVIMIFAIASFSVVEMQLISARHIHASAINQIQSSYYTVDIDAINDEIKSVYPEVGADGKQCWRIETKLVDSTNNRKDMLVTMYYKITLPIFDVSKTGKIEGYAR